MFEFGAFVRDVFASLLHLIKGPVTQSNVGKVYLVTGEKALLSKLPIGMWTHALLILDLKELFFCKWTKGGTVSC